MTLKIPCSSIILFYDSRKLEAGQRRSRQEKITGLYARAKATSSPIPVSKPHRSSLPIPLLVLKPQQIGHPWCRIEPLSPANTNVLRDHTRRCSYQGRFKTKSYRDFRTG